MREIKNENRDDGAKVPEIPALEQYRRLCESEACTPRHYQDLIAALREIEVEALQPQPISVGVAAINCGVASAERFGSEMPVRDVLEQISQAARVSAEPGFSGNEIKLIVQSESHSGAIVKLGISKGYPLCGPCSALYSPFPYFKSSSTARAVDVEKIFTELCLRVPASDECFEAFQMNFEPLVQAQLKLREQSLQGANEEELLQTERGGPPDEEGHHGGNALPVPPDTRQTGP